MNHVSLTIDSRPENVPLLGFCSREIAGNRFSLEKLSEIEQALVETVNNCIEHAYCGSDDCQITIKFELSNDRLFIEITDQGEQLDTERLNNLHTAFNFDPLDIDNLPEGGFGLKVINRCMDEVNYRHEDGRNHWTLTKFIIKPT